MAITCSEAKIEALEKTVQAMQANISTLTKSATLIAASQAKMLESQTRIEQWVFGKVSTDLDHRMESEQVRMVVNDDVRGQEELFKDEIVGESDRNAYESKEEKKANGQTVKEESLLIQEQLQCDDDSDESEPCSFVPENLTSLTSRVEEISLNFEEMNIVSMGGIGYTSADSIDFILVARYNRSNMNKIVSATQTDPCACGSYYWYGDLFASHGLRICAREIESKTQGYQWKVKKPPDQATRSWGYPAALAQGQQNAGLEIVSVEHWTGLEWYRAEEKHKAQFSIRPKINYWKAKEALIRASDLVQSVGLLVGYEKYTSDYFLCLLIKKDRAHGIITILRAQSIRADHLFHDVKQINNSQHHMVENEGFPELRLREVWEELLEAERTRVGDFNLRGLVVYPVEGRLCIFVMVQGRVLTRKQDMGHIIKDGDGIWKSRRIQWLITAGKTKDIFPGSEEVIVWDELCYCCHREIGMDSKHLGVDEKWSKVFQVSEIQVSE